MNIGSIVHATSKSRTKANKIDEAMFANRGLESPILLTAVNKSVTSPEVQRMHEVQENTPPGQSTHRSKPDL